MHCQNVSFVHCARCRRGDISKRLRGGDLGTQVGKAL